MNTGFRFLVIIWMIVNAQMAFSQQGIVLSESGLAMALEKAKSENKPVFFMCFTTWCPHCKYMMKTVFKDPEVADFYNQHFVCIAQDMEKGEGISLLKSLKINSFPTFIFFDPNGTTLYRITGELKSEQFLQEGKNALIPQKQLPSLKQQFDNDISNANKCFNYLKTLKNAQLDYSTVVKQYFSTQSDQQLLNEINWRIIANGVSDINSREFRFVLSHQKEFSSIASPERVNRKIFYLVKELLTPLVETKDTTNYFIARKSASEIHIFNVDSLIFTYDLKLYELTANWDAYREISLQSTTTYLWNDYIQLNIIATNYLKHISDTLALLKAVQWTQRALSLNEEYSICLLGSKLYQKMNKIPDAIQMAQQGKDIAVKYGWDSTEPDRLLNELKSTPKNN